MGRLTERDVLRARINVVLPVKDKDDLLWRLYFGPEVGPFGRDAVEGYQKFYAKTDMAIRRLVWSEVDAKRWTFDHGLFRNLRKVA